MQVVYITCALSARRAPACQPHPFIMSEQCLKPQPPHVLHGCALCAILLIEEVTAGR